MQARLERLEYRATKRRQIAKEAMVELELKKLTAPDFMRKRVQSPHPLTTQLTKRTQLFLNDLSPTNRS
jgi:hypothetical protein